MIPSKHQKAVYNEIESGNTNLCIDAVAGSGKTTTCLEALKLIPNTKKVAFLAFNKSIVEELKSRCNQSNVDIKTLHAAGFGACIRVYKSKLNNYKYTSFLDKNMYILSNSINIDTSNEDISRFKATTLKLLGLCRSTLSYTVEEISKLAEKHEIDLTFDEADVCIKLMKWGSDNCKEIDFTDMIWIPVVKRLEVNKYDFVFIDEAQDLNNAQRELMLKMVSIGGRFVAVGDPRQSINGFAGADTESFQKLASLPNTKTLPLSVCYRCASSVIELAKEIVPYIECKEGAEVGVAGENIQSLKGVNHEDMILCRVTAPLVTVCMKFLKNGIAAYVKGKDIGENLIALIKRTKTDDLEVMFEILKNELYKLSIKISNREDISMEDAKNDYSYLALQDKIDCLSNLTFNCSNTKELISTIKDLFKDKDKGICLSTCHKSKGLEANRVFVVEPKKLPLKRCMNVEWKAEQEMNLKYVTITRAKKELYFVDCDVKDIEVV